MNAKTVTDKERAAREAVLRAMQGAAESERIGDRRGRRGFDRNGWKLKPGDETSNI